MTWVIYFSINKYYLPFYWRKYIATFECKLFFTYYCSINASHIESNVYFAVSINALFLFYFRIFSPKNRGTELDNGDAASSSTIAFRVRGGSQFNKYDSWSLAESMCSEGGDVAASGDSLGGWVAPFEEEKLEEERLRKELKIAKKKQKQQQKMQVPPKYILLAYWLLSTQMSVVIAVVALLSIIIIMNKISMCKFLK